MDEAIKKYFLKPDLVSIQNLNLVCERLERVDQTVFQNYFEVELLNKDQKLISKKLIILNQLAKNKIKFLNEEFFNFNLCNFEVIFKNLFSNSSTKTDLSVIETFLCLEKKFDSNINHSLEYKNLVKDFFFAIEKSEMKLLNLSSKLLAVTVFNSNTDKSLIQQQFQSLFEEISLKNLHLHFLFFVNAFLHYFDVATIYKLCGFLEHSHSSAIFLNDLLLYSVNVSSLIGTDGNVLLCQIFLKCFKIIEKNGDEVTLQKSTINEVCSYLWKTFEHKSKELKKEVMLCIPCIFKVKSIFECIDSELLVKKFLGKPATERNLIYPIIPLFFTENLSNAESHFNQFLNLTLKDLSHQHLKLKARDLFFFLLSKKFKEFEIKEFSIYLKNLLLSEHADAYTLQNNIIPMLNKWFSEAMWLLISQIATFECVTEQLLKVFIFSLNNFVVEKMLDKNFAFSNKMKGTFSIQEYYSFSFLDLVTIASNNNNTILKICALELIVNLGDYDIMEKLISAKNYLLFLLKFDVNAQEEKRFQIILKNLFNANLCKEKFTKLDLVQNELIAIIFDSATTNNRFNIQLFAIKFCSNIMSDSNLILKKRISEFCFLLITHSSFELCRRQAYSLILNQTFDGLEEKARDLSTQKRTIPRLASAHVWKLYFSMISSSEMCIFFNKSIQNLNSLISNEHTALHLVHGVLISIEASLDFVNIEEVNVLCINLLFKNIFYIADLNGEFNKNLSLCTFENEEVSTGDESFLEESVMRSSSWRAITTGLNILTKIYTKRSPLDLPKKKVWDLLIGILIESRHWGILQSCQKNFEEFLVFFFCKAAEGDNQLVLDWLKGLLRKVGSGEITSERIDGRYFGSVRVLILILKNQSFCEKVGKNFYNNYIAQLQSHALTESDSKSNAAAQAILALLIKNQDINPLMSIDKIFASSLSGLKKQNLNGKEVNLFAVILTILLGDAGSAAIENGEADEGTLNFTGLEFFKTYELSLKEIQSFNNENRNGLYYVLFLFSKFRSINSTTVDTNDVPLLEWLRKFCFDALGSTTIQIRKLASKAVLKLYDNSSLDHLIDLVSLSLIKKDSNLLHGILILIHLKLLNFKNLNLIKEKINCKFLKFLEEVYLSLILEKQTKMCYFSWQVFVEILNLAIMHSSTKDILFEKQFPLVFDLAIFNQDVNKTNLGFDNFLVSTVDLYLNYFNSNEILFLDTLKLLMKKNVNVLTNAILCWLNTNWDDVFCKRLQFSDDICCLVLQLLSKIFICDRVNNRNILENAFTLLLKESFCFLNSNRPAPKEKIFNLTKELFEVEKDESKLKMLSFKLMTYLKTKFLYKTVDINFLNLWLKFVDLNSTSHQPELRQCLVSTFICFKEILCCEKFFKGADVDVTLKSKFALLFIKFLEDSDGMVRDEAVKTYHQLFSSLYVFDPLYCSKELRNGSWLK
ncbi:hypothetical protein HDU92_009155 [Lobulomyces angularis]|nr:hypothetical protein HDU92_009155 [Lobulomyces angularis]